MGAPIPTAAAAALAAAAAAVVLAAAAAALAATAAALAAAAAAQTVLHDAQTALGFDRPHIHYVTGEYLGVQIGRYMKTVSKNAKILPQITSQLFLHGPSNSQFINLPIT